MSRASPPSPPPAAGAPLSPAEALALADQRLAQGDAAAAESLCRRILGARPDFAPALHLLGVIASRSGDWPSAIGFVRRAVQADPANALYASNLCEMCRRGGDLDQALAAGERACAIAPDFPHALNNLAIVRFERGEYDLAASLYRRVIDLAPGHAEAHNNLGNVLRTGRDFDQALAAYGRALALRPWYPDALNNLGTTHRDMGRTEDAERAYRKAHALDPLNVSVIANLALAVKDLERLDEAAALFECALRLDPAGAVAFTRLAQVRLEQDRLDDARAAAQRALALAPDDPEALNVLGVVAFKRNRPHEALAYFDRSIGAKPDFAEAHSNLGNLFRELGRIPEAKAAHARAADLDPRQAGFFLNLADGHRFVSETDRHLAGMLALERDIDSLTPIQAMHLRFALAKAYDDLGQPDRAFAHLAAASSLKRARIAYDEAHVLGLMDRIRLTFDPALLARHEAGGDASERPVFIIGMPRSGTSLVEQIIASHGQVHGAGELDFLAAALADVAGAEHGSNVFPELALRWAPQTPGAIGATYVGRIAELSATAARITDKMPANFMFAGLIHLALPRARIIHVVRDPVDTCLSCFSKLFADEQHHTYDLAELGRYYRKYWELMAHWRSVLPAGRMLEIRYEDVVADLEGQARRLIAHCGLDWDERCLAFHESARPVRTASADQVRRPLYATSKGRSHAYREHLAPLIAALGDLA